MTTSNIIIKFVKTRDRSRNGEESEIKQRNVIEKDRKCKNTVE